MSAVEVHAVVSGPTDAPVVVLSNSLGSTHRMWDAQIAELERHFRVVRYDTRGHGDSPVPDGPYSIDDLADDLVALLDRLGVQRARLVGLSLGGMTVMRVASRNPDRVERIALLCTGAQLPPAGGWMERAATVRAQGSRAVAAADVAPRAHEYRHHVLLEGNGPLFLGLRHLHRHFHCLSVERHHHLSRAVDERRHDRPIQFDQCRVGKADLCLRGDVAGDAVWLSELHHERLPVAARLEVDVRWVDGDLLGEKC